MFIRRELAEERYRMFISVYMLWLSVLSNYAIIVSKEAKIRNRYNQVTHLTQDATWESDKKTIKHDIQESQVASPFPAGDHKAAMNRQESMTNTNHKQQNDPQKQKALERSVKIVLPEGLNYFHGINLTLSSDVDKDT